MEDNKKLYDFDLDQLNGDTWDTDFKKIKDKVRMNDVYAKFVTVLCKTLIGNEEQYIDIKTINHYVKKTPDYINKVAENFINLKMLIKTQKGRKNYYIINHAYKTDWEFLLKSALELLKLEKNKVDKK